jgi:hypothetical protein
MIAKRDTCQAHWGVRFVLYMPASIRKCKIDWEHKVPIDASIRAAMHPQEVDRMRQGVLRRPFKSAPREPSVRAKRAGARAAEGHTHAKGALVFAYAGGEAFYIEVAEDPE